VPYDQDTIRRLFKDSMEAGATDIHLKVPGRPRFRVQGQLISTPYPPLAPVDTQRIAQEVLGLARVETGLAGLTEIELSFGLDRLGRFRAHIYRQRGSFGLVVHRMALQAPTLAELGADPQIGPAVWAEPGLVLVTGQQRRLAVLAALVRHYNEHEKGFLLALERPMEFMHADQQAVVSQREVGQDTPGFAEGLRWALDGDCDAITCADLPDPAAAEAALRAAENGRRVVVSLLGCPAPEAVRWFVRMFPPTREKELLSRLKRVLRLQVFERKGEVKAAAGERLFQGLEA